jgi:anaerobic selenocysteine-containing dehydrogenase
LKKEKIPENAEQKESGEVSRRDFLVGAGTVVVGGAIGAGLLSSCGETVTTTVKETSTKTVPTTITAPGTTETKTVAGPGGEVITVTETKTITAPGGGGIEPWQEEEKTIVFCGKFAEVIDIKNGKIVRERPLHYDSSYPELQPWTISARGKTFTVPLKNALPPIHGFFKKRYDSPNRILYPLKRVDWEPGGDPEKINPQNRGISKYKRISWEEATDTIAYELKRVADTYGVEAISTLRGANHNEEGNVHGTTAFEQNFFNYWALKNYGKTITETCQEATSWCGGQIGGQYVMGVFYEPKPGMLGDIIRHTDMLICNGNTAAGSWYMWAGSIQAPFYFWFGDLGIKRVFICPDMNHGAGVHADKWIPIYPSTDCALYLAVAYTWITENLYDKDYIETHTVGFDIWKAYVLGEEDGVPKTPEWASPLCGVSKWLIKALAREWAQKVTSVAYGHLGGGLGRAPYSSESQRMQLYLLAMQAWGRPGIHQLTGFSNTQGGFLISEAEKTPTISHG